MGRAARDKKLKKALASLQQQHQASGVLINVEGDVKEDWRKADQEYFERHPEKTMYVRSVFPGELPALPHVKKVQVRLIATGTRIRVPLE
jgi:hypothetical protein